MECQETLECVVVEYETVVDEDDFEPQDLADQAYEQWRDEERSLEVPSTRKSIFILSFFYHHVNKGIYSFWPGFFPQIR